MINILYVEDEVFLAQVVKESLERLGHTVLHLSDGSKILTNFKSFSPDLCILDIMLPLKNGYEIAKEIREIDNSIPIIFLTAKSQTQDVIHGFKSGGNDYVKKPFSMEELQVRIENLMAITKNNIQQPSKNDIIEIGENYNFHVLKQQLAYKNDIQSLSYKEAQILTLLCEHINNATERKDILMKVWNDDSYFNSRNLDVYIRKLRKYLSKDDRIQIITLKGVGYHFVVE